MRFGACNQKGIKRPDPRVMSARLFYH
jgi:hypothetical protein